MKYLIHSVEEMITAILRREGGFVNHPNDRGGATKYGVTRKTLSQWLQRPASIQDVRNMTEAQARDIYETRYYVAPRISTLPDMIEPFVFDCSINHGPRRAIKLVQQVVNKAGFGPVDVDGVIGPQSRSCIETACHRMQGWFINALVDERINFYDLIIQNNPSQKVFERGWKRRAEEFRITELYEDVA